MRRQTRLSSAEGWSNRQRSTEKRRSPPRDFLLPTSQQAFSSTTPARTVLTTTGRRLMARDRRRLQPTRALDQPDMDGDVSAVANKSSRAGIPTPTSLQALRRRFGLQAMTLMPNACAFCNLARACPRPTTPSVLHAIRSRRILLTLTHACAHSRGRYWSSSRIRANGQGQWDRYTGAHWVPHVRRVSLALHIVAALRLLR